MANITIKINTDNDAFSNRPELELTRILKELGEGILSRPHLLYFNDVIKLYDINGNAIGNLEIKISEE